MSFKKIGENRYRAHVGQYFEEFKVGDVYEHRPGRTMTDVDNIHFSLLTMNYNPMHCDAAFAEQSEFGKLLINSGLTLAVVLGMSVADISGKAIANLGWTNIRLLAPVFAGDTIYAESEVLALRESKSRPTQGIITVRTTGKKANESVFMTFERSVLIPKIGHGVNEANY